MQDMPLRRWGLYIYIYIYAIENCHENGRAVHVVCRFLIVFGCYKRIWHTLKFNNFWTCRVFFGFYEVRLVNIRVFKKLSHNRLSLLQTKSVQEEKHLLKNQCSTFRFLFLEGHSAVKMYRRLVKTLGNEVLGESIVYERYRALSLKVLSVKSSMSRIT